jgi:hypothetical protein
MPLRLRMSDHWMEPANRAIAVRQVLLEERTEAGALVCVMAINVEVARGREDDVQVVFVSWKPEQAEVKNG